MHVRAFDKSRLSSRHVTEAPQLVSYRSRVYAIGPGRQQIRRPSLRLASSSCWNEAAPCGVAPMPRVWAFASAGARGWQVPAPDDVIEIDGRRGVAELHPCGAETAAHMKPWTPRRHEFGSGAFCKYAQLVGPARAGAVTHSGGAGETQIYANV